MKNILFDLVTILEFGHQIPKKLILDNSFDPCTLLLKETLDSISTTVLFIDHWLFWVLDVRYELVFFNFLERFNFIGRNGFVLFDLWRNHDGMQFEDKSLTVRLTLN
jgi:hypothetical protein